MEDSFTSDKRSCFHIGCRRGLKPALRAKPTSKDGGEPCRNQVNLGRAWLTRSVVNVKA
jgi:hypothetical protein